MDEPKKPSVNRLSEQLPLHAPDKGSWQRIASRLDLIDAETDFREKLANLPVHSPDSSTWNTILTHLNRAAYLKTGVRIALSAAAGLLLFIAVSRIIDTDQNKTPAPALAIQKQSDTENANKNNRKISQAAQLHNKFLNFSLNRMNHAKSKVPQVVGIEINYTKNTSSKHSLESFLRRQKTLLNSITERHTSKDNRDLVGCTFAPKILNKKRNSSTEDRKQHIDMLAKQAKKELGKTTNDIEFEKQANHLTFSPLINRNIIKASFKVEIKGAASIVQRLRSSYIEKDRAHKQLAYREYNSSKLTKKKVVKSAEPCIFIDVNMGNKEERISIYEGDDPEKVAFQFGKLHSMIITQILMSKQLESLRK